MATRKLGEVVQHLWEARGLTQAQLAEHAQAGNNASPAIVQRLARALGVTPSKLTEGEESP